MSARHLIPAAQQLLHLRTGEADEPFVERLISEDEKRAVMAVRACPLTPLKFKVLSVGQVLRARFR